MSQISKCPNITIAFIGCGNMGGALLSGILGGLSESTDKHGNKEESRVILKACTRTKTSADALGKLFDPKSSVGIVHGSNVDTIRSADVIILAFKPYMLHDVFQEPGIRDALKGKLIISLLAGVEVATIQALAENDGTSETDAVWVAKAMPNIAAKYRQSVTAIEELPASFPNHYKDHIEWIFSQVGMIKYLPPSLLDLGTVFTTACLSTISVALDGLLDGCVVEGLRRQDAMEIASQGLIGLGTVLAHGTHPAILRDNMSSPRGCTIQTLVTLEKAGVRGLFAQALTDGVQHLKTMQGTKDK